MLNMKNIHKLSLSILLLTSVLSISGCNTKIQLNKKQAEQILTMILYKQSQMTESEKDFLMDEVSYRYTSGDVVDIIEISKANSVVHRKDTESEDPESWYYLLDNVLYKASRESEEEEYKKEYLNRDTEAAPEDFKVNYLSKYGVTAQSIISKVDNPSYFIDLLDDYIDDNESNYHVSFSSKKDGNLKVGVKIYDNRRKDNLQTSFEFEYDNYLLLNYSFNDSNSNESFIYTIRYETVISVDPFR